MGYFLPDNNTNAAALPAEPAIGTQGYFTDGTPPNIPPTTVDAWWLNTISCELNNILEAAGITPAKGALNQLATVLQLMGSGVVGSMRNAKMSVAAASSSATFTADEIVVETALGGFPFRLASFNETINIAENGAGGVDTGPAPVSGFVALYAIYNPTTGATALLATNATSAVAPSVYGGSAMPSGYTASALVSVWPTNTGAQLVDGYQMDRSILIASSAVLTTTAAAAITGLSISTVVPPNARAVSGNLQITFGASAGGTISVFPTSVGFGGAGNNFSSAGAGSSSIPFRDMPLGARQTIYYGATINIGAPTFAISIVGYDI